MYVSFTYSCEQFTCCCVLLQAVYDCYELFTSHPRKNQSVDTREKIFDMSKNLRLLSRILTSDYELAIRNDS